MWPMLPTSRFLSLTGAVAGGLKSHHHYLCWEVVSASKSSLPLLFVVSLTPSLAHGLHTFYGCSHVTRVEAETVGPAKPATFTSWPFAEKVYLPLF